MEVTSFLKDWIIPIVSILLSVWFAASAKRDADRAQQVLDRLKDAIEGWETQIMNAATDLLNNNPQIVEGKRVLADAQARANALALALNVIEGQLKSGGSPHEMSVALKELGSIARQLYGLEPGSADI